MKKAIMFLVTVLVVEGCGASKSVVIQDYTPQFKYMAKSTGGGTKEVSLAILNPIWKDASDQALKAQVATQLLTMGVTGMTDYQNAAFTQFTNSLNADFEKLLTDKGFTLSGPFANLDEMTFPQKQQSDLAVLTEIEFQIKGFSPLAKEDLRSNQQKAPDFNPGMNATRVT